MAKKKFTAKVLFGSEVVSQYLAGEKVDGDGMLIKREFETEAELKAYFAGLDDGDGWCDYATLTDAEFRRIKKTMDSE